VDAGDAIVTREVEIRQGETEEQLEERMHAVEHKLIVEGTHKTLEGLRKQ
jgi:phosphoribosylglycinamide formyltransferase